MSMRSIRSEAVRRGIKNEFSSPERGAVSSRRMMLLDDEHFHPSFCKIRAADETADPSANYDSIVSMEIIFRH